MNGGPLRKRIIRSFQLLLLCLVFDTVFQESRSMFKNSLQSITTNSRKTSRYNFSRKMSWNDWMILALHLKIFCFVGLSIPILLHMVTFWLFMLESVPHFLEKGIFKRSHYYLLLISLCDFWNTFSTLSSMLNGWNFIWCLKCRAQLHKVWKL